MKFESIDETLTPPGYTIAQDEDHIVFYKIQRGPQKCLYFSLAITFIKIRKPSRFFLHRYWKFIEFF